jgi:purine nucleosidase
MVRKVILDVDPGIDDAVAITMALFDPRLDVLALTAVSGNVAASQVNRNLQAVVEQLDPPRWPRLGAAAEPERRPDADARHIYGADGLGNANFPVAELHHLHASEKVLTDELRGDPGNVTVLALGPLTNVAATFRRDPALAGQVGHLVMMGGTISGPGNVTPAAEFNIYCDPLSARAVFRAPVTSTLVPLDVSSQVIFGYDLLDELPRENTRAGRFLRRILPHAFRTHRQVLGTEGIHLHDCVALVAVTNPELFQLERMAADVETAGELTLGATVFDRRPNRVWRPNLYVAVDVDVEGVKDSILRGIKQAGEATRD